MCVFPVFSVTVPVTKFHSESQAWFAPASMHLPAKLSHFQDLKTPETVEKSRDSSHLRRETLTTRPLNVWLDFTGWSNKRSLFHPNTTVDAQRVCLQLICHLKYYLVLNHHLWYANLTFTTENLKPNSRIINMIAFAYNSTKCSQNQAKRAWHSPIS